MTYTQDELNAERYAALDEADNLREAGEALITIAEGIKGAMGHGTRRAEKSNLHLKDTTEWAVFYAAHRAARTNNGEGAA